MSTTEIPASASAASMSALNQAMSETSIKPASGANGGDDSGSSSPTSEPKELGSDDLEEGEIRDGDDEDNDDVEDDGTVKTVFDDSRRFNVKHPLYSNWTLYFDSPNSKNLPKPPAQTPSTPLAHGGWMDDMRKVVTFQSVEEFWGTYNNIVPPSQLPGKANYYLFKDDIMPAWEDAQNKDGGKWSIQVPREKSKPVIDKMWLYTMLAAIGETFETPLSKPGEKPSTPAQSDLVTGVIVNARPGFYRIAIWTRQAADTKLTDADALMARILLIGRHFKVSVLGFEPEQKIVTGGLQTEVEFESHKDSEKKGNKNKIVV